MILFCFTIAFVQTEWGQNWLAKKVTTRLSKDLQSRISIKHLRIGLFNKMNLEGVLVEDRARDTLLYAGTVQVRITDWFFFQDKVELKYIGLEDAVIKLQRTDTVWNYSFLQDYFASPSSGKKKKSGIELDLKKVVMRNVSFVQKDGWAGQDLYARVSYLNMDANEITVTNKRIDIASLELEQPSFHQFAYKGNRPEGYQSRPKAADPVTEARLQWNPDNWNIVLDRLSIDSGRYRNDWGTIGSNLSYFDGKHLDFRSIDGSVRNFRWLGDTLTAQVDLTTTERSGLQVKTLQTNLRFHPQLMEFNNLDLQTNRSRLGNYFSMKFDDFGDMNDFIHAVYMQGKFKNSYIASDDIAFFAPETRDWNRVIRLDGTVRGTVDAISGDNVTIHAGQNTSLAGNFSIVGLPDINTTFINIDANDLHTNYADVVTFLPYIRNVQTPNLRTLGSIRFRGSYTGFLNDFVTYGTVQTALGTLTTDLNMKLPRNGPPVYSGTISTNNFNLGRFINHSQLGSISFSGDVRGRGFKWSTLDMKVDGTIGKLQFGKYTYQNIKANGRLNNQSFNGDFLIKDPNADLSLNGLITFGGPVPTFNVTADVTKANLKALQLSREDISLSGQFDLNFSGRSISDLLGNARIKNAILLHNDNEIGLESLVISSDYIGGVRTLQANADQFEATVTGQFDLESLPDAFMVFLNRYYPAYIKPAKRNVPNQSFTFDITTGVVEDFVKLIDSRLSGFNNSRISGSLDIRSNNLTLNADVPQFGFSQYQFSDVQLRGDGNFERLVLNGQVNNAVVSDSLVFPQTTFTVQAQNDVSDITINTTANQTINQANLSARVRTFANGISVLFNPSSFVLNGKTWSVEQGGELDFRRNTVVQGNLVLRESMQEIRLSTQPSDVGTWNDLHVSLQKIILGDFMPFLVTTNRIEGLLSADIIVEDPQNRFNVVSDNIRVQQLRIDNDSLGEVSAEARYENRTGLITANGRNADPQHSIVFDMALDLKDSANLHTDRITLRPTNFEVKILERFIGGLFSDLRGFLSGQLDILEDGDAMKYVGTGRLKDAGLKVNFTQVFYTIDDTEIELKEREVDFGELKLRDRFGNTATVQGTIAHNNFRNMIFDIVAEVDDEPMELLNTTYNDNQQFYGRAMGTGSLVLIGPQYDMNMYIEAIASEEDSSYITIPPSRSRASGTAGFMVERKYGREMTGEDLRGSSSNITYEVNVTANPLVNVEVILDELTGDVIRGRGTGNLRMRAGTSEPLTIRGRYNIEEGNYLFTFQSFFKKPFELRRGSNNFIEWTGDPYAANIQFDAVYEAQNVSFLPLVSSLALDQRLSNLRGDVNVIALLRGELFRPTFTFKIEFPENSDAYSDPSLAFGIQQIEKNTNEINKQVTFLIVLNQFAPYESLQSTYNPLNEFAYSTISGLFFGEINKRLNQWFSSLLRNNDLTFNFSGSLYNRNLIDQNAKGFNINQSNLNVSVSKPLLNERVQITFGGTFDVPLESNIEQNVRLFPDVNVEFLVNKSGSLRATFFYTQSPDLLIGGAQTGSLRNQRAGAKLSYRKEFDSLGEFFFGKPKTKKPKETGVPKVQVPADSTLTGSR